MNEKIEELISTCIDQKWTVTGPMFEREKFAELIVKDVIDLILTKSRIEQVNKNDKVVILYCDLVNDIREEYGVD